MVHNPNALVTLDQVKLQLDIPLANTSYDDLLEGFIDATSDHFENYTNRYLKQRTGLEQYSNGDGKAELLMHQWPITKPSEVWIDSTSQFTDPSKQLDPSEYELILDGRGQGVGIILLKYGDYCRFPVGRRNIKVVYDGGYATVPYDIQNRAIWAVEYMYDMRSDRRMGTESKGKNQETTRFLENLPGFITDVLDAYRRMEWAVGPIQSGAL